MNSKQYSRYIRIASQWEAMLCRDGYRKIFDSQYAFSYFSKLYHSNGNRVSISVGPQGVLMMKNGLLVSRAE